MTIIYPPTRLPVIRTDCAIEWIDRAPHVQQVNCVC
jgi:hypothetical protein